MMKYWKYTHSARTNKTSVYTIFVRRVGNRE